MSESSSPRGVREADFFGPNGERVLLAVTSQNRLASKPIYLACELDSEPVKASLARLLEIVDPALALCLPDGSRHVRPRQRFLGRQVGRPR